jgi:hypothetical protein
MSSKVKKTTNKKGNVDTTPIEHYSYIQEGKK